MHQTAYICTLPEGVQNFIQKQLVKKHLPAKEIRTAMSGRLCDLEEIIDWRCFA